MNLDDIKDQLNDQFQQLWAKIQDNSTYIRLKEKYDNLSPNGQKLTLFGAGMVVVLVALSIPYGTLTQSSTYMTEFEEKRALIRELMKVSREAGQTPQMPGAIEIGQAQGMIQEELTRQQLLPEQIVSTQGIEVSKSLIPQNVLSGALEVQLAKLNIQQISNIAFFLQSMAPNLKLEAMSLIANTTDPRYFNANFRIVGFNVPKLPEPEPEAKPSRPKRGGSK